MVANTTNELARLDEAFLALAQADSLDQVKQIRDKAEAVRTFAKAAQYGLEMQNRAAELKIRAERKAGQFLAKLHLSGGNRKSKQHDVTLTEIGISRMQSSRWQRIAAVPEDQLCKYLASALEGRKEISSAALLRIATAPKGKRRKLSTGKRLRAATVSSREVTVEALNHLQLLAKILTPAFENKTVILKPAERRHVLHLLRETLELVTQAVVSPEHPPEFVDG